MTCKFIRTRRLSRFERAMHSKKVKAKHFPIVPGGVETTNRRLRDGSCARCLAFYENNPIWSLEQLLLKTKTTGFLFKLLNRKKKVYAWVGDGGLSREQSGVGVEHIDQDIALKPYSSNPDGLKVIKPTMPGMEAPDAISWVLGALTKRIGVSLVVKSLNSKKPRP